MAGLSGVTKISGTTGVRPTNPPNGYDIFLIIGQSNTYSGEEESGQSLPESPQDDSDSDIFQIGRWDGDDDTVISATEPLDHVGFNGRPESNLVGFGLMFAKIYKAQGYLASNRDILLVPCGEGGTGLEDGNWVKGGTRYNDAIDRVQIALAAGEGSNKLKGILWHQGEDDTTNQTEADNYPGLLHQMIDDMRADLGYDQVPFIAGGMVPNWVNNIGTAGAIGIKQDVQAALADLPNQRNFTGYANPASPTELTASATDETNHYSADSMRGSEPDPATPSTTGFAGRYWTAYLSALTNK